MLTTFRVSYIAEKHLRRLYIPNNINTSKHLFYSVICIRDKSKSNKKEKKVYTTIATMYIHHYNNSLFRRHNT